MPVCAVDQTTLQIALTLPFTDYEDAVQHASATGNGIAAIVTRNAKDFSGATVPILSPAELLAQLPAQSSKE
jgi:hypothetical protein